MRAWHEYVSNSCWRGVTVDSDLDSQLVWGIHQQFHGLAAVGRVAKECRDRGFRIALAYQMLF